MKAMETGSNVYNALFNEVNEKDIKYLIRKAYQSNDRPIKMPIWNIFS